MGNVSESAKGSPSRFCEDGRGLKQGEYMKGGITLEKKKIRLRTPTTEELAVLDELIPTRDISMWDVVRCWMPGSKSTGLPAFPTPWGWWRFLDLYESGKYSKDELERQVKVHWEKIGYDGMFRSIDMIIDENDKELFG